MSCRCDTVVKITDEQIKELKAKIQFEVYKINELLEVAAKNNLKLNLTLKDDVLNLSY